MSPIAKGRLVRLALGLGCISGVYGVTFAVPATAPDDAGALDPAPVAISFETFAFPAYFKDVSATQQCLTNLKDLSGTWPPIRIGGTTGDRATFDATQSEYVIYSVAASTDAPDSLTYGPAFMSLAGTYPGTVVVGLDRGHNDIENVIEAANSASSNIPTLLAVELGNEPEYWLNAKQPIAIESGTWTPEDDAYSQNDWDVAVGSALNRGQIIQAGNSLKNPPAWGAAELIAVQNATAQSYVQTYAHHNYPGGSVTSLMSHKNVVSNVGGFKTDIAAAAAVGKDYVMGETNSVAGGGAAAVSPLFGAGLWVMDYVLQATSVNIKRIYFHHGTLGACSYCWWGRYSMGAPYYGAYAAATALANGSFISPLDDGTTTNGAYVIYDSKKTPIKVVLYNSLYFDSSSADRTNTTFVLNGLTTGSGGIGDVSVKAKRLTAAGAETRVDDGGVVTFGGQTFGDVTCAVAGSEVFEMTAVLQGNATFQVGESEALIIWLD